jgi:hypothetical protein
VNDSYDWDEMAARIREEPATVVSRTYTWYARMPNEDWWQSVWPEPEIPLREGWRWRLDVATWDLGDGERLRPEAQPSPRGAHVTLSWTPCRSDQ